MTTLHTAAQQALDALEGAHKVLSNSLRIADAIEALRAALARPTRQELQKDGKHPAPCARFCESTAYEIEARGLRKRIADLEAQPQAQPPLPEGWEPLVITHAGQYPEEIAYGPKRMMDRLDKWLTKYFADLAQAQPEQAKPKAKLFLPQGDARTARVVWSELKEGVLELCITVIEPPIAQPAVSADAYDGAREDLAIWKKRALEAESINRKFIAEVNGLTHMGEPPIAQPAKATHSTLNDAIQAHIDSRADMTVIKPAKPQNCGTSFCSCIECVMESAQAEKSCATCKKVDPSDLTCTVFRPCISFSLWEPK